MEDSDGSPCVVPAAFTGKRRIPKACTSCRQSKVKCDGKRPCSRCNKLKKHCVFFQVPKDPTTERLENVESEVRLLREQLEEMRQLLRHHSRSNPDETASQTQDQVHHHPGYSGSTFTSSSQVGSHSDTIPTLINAVPETSPRSFEYREQHGMSSSGEVPVHSLLQTRDPDTVRLAKRKRSGFEIRDEPISDFIHKGLITIEHAMTCFRTFFQGCDRYIPIFDPEYDTFSSVRARSSILLNAICTVGCRVETKTGSQMSDHLHAELKRWINVVIQNKKLNCLESVQAMLVVACYSAERSLILSFATQMALDLNMDEAFEELTQKLAIKEAEEIYNLLPPVSEEERTLMRKARTWFGLLVLEHIFRVDGGKPPGIRLTGNARRCRILLSHPSSTVLDLRLFSQVELNILRANINDTLGGRGTLDRPDIVDYVHEAKVDLDLWFDDWLRIIEISIAAVEERPFLLLALRVQKCWAEMMLHCKALRAMGVENVAAMSPIEKNVLLMAKASARKHLLLITVEPDFYLAKLKYAMDFVWAKCAFCFLLLIKLSRLLPEQEEEHRELLEHGRRLLDELNRVGSTSDSSSNGNIYLQILRLSIDKYGRTLQESEMDTVQAATAPFWESFDAQADLQSFVPEQFVSEWDFPGLNLFYFPTAWQDFFGDFPLAI